MHGSEFAPGNPKEKNKKFFLKNCQKCLSRVYIICGDFLLCGADSYLPT